MSALTQLTTTETRLFFRDPVNVIFGPGLAPTILIILGSIPSFRVPDPDLGGLRVIDLYTPILVATAIATLALNVLPQLLAGYRQRGILRRLRTTPVKPATMLGAQLIMCTGLSVATMLVLLAIARLAFGVRLPDHPVAYLMAFVLASMAMLAVGLLVASLAPSGAAAGGIGPLLMFPFLFFAGLWVPREAMDDVLRTISDASPLGAGVASLQNAAVGDWPQLVHVAVLLGWTILAGGLAARFFRWD